MRPLALIGGVGEGLGANLAATFAGEGFDIVGLSRSERAASAIADKVRIAGGRYTHRTVDLTEEDAVATAIRPLADRVTVFIHLVHELMMQPFGNTTSADFERVWRAGCLSAMLVARELAPAMIARGEGTIILSGATASIRGGARFAAFASAKFALRGFAQSLARELGPRHVHVAHIVLDGLVDELQSTARFGVATAPRMDSMAVAQAYLSLVRQHPTAWTHELDLRPFAEAF